MEQSKISANETAYIFPPIGAALSALSVSEKSLIFFSKAVSRKSKEKLVETLGKLN